MTKKIQPSSKIEREYVIPLREKCRPVPRYKKTPKAVKTIKQFLLRHMKIRDKDLNKIKINPYLNEMLWFRGIKNPPHKIKVKVTKEKDIVKVEAFELMKKLDFKKKRLEKREQLAEETLEKKKTMMQKAKEQMQGQPQIEKPKDGSDLDQDGVKDKKEEKEKQKSVEKASEERTKKQAQNQKHQTKINPKKGPTVKRAPSR